MTVNTAFIRSCDGGNAYKTLVYGQWSVAMLCTLTAFSLVIKNGKFENIYYEKYTKRKKNLDFSDLGTNGSKNKFDQSTKNNWFRLAQFCADNIHVFCYWSVLDVFDIISDSIHVEFFNMNFLEF